MGTRRTILRRSAILATVGAVGAKPVLANTEVEISDTVGRGGWTMRYVGSEPTTGSYRRGRPRIEVEPSEGPVVFDGSLDFSNANEDAVAMIGLVDKNVIDEGRHGYQTGAYLYALYRGEDVRIGVSDGNPGNVDGPHGELIRESVTIEPTDEVPVTFTVDGTVANPEDCGEDPGWGEEATGCMTLQVNGDTVTDSYGWVRDGDAADDSGLVDGAIAGWDAFPRGTTGIAYDLTVTDA